MAVLLLIIVVDFIAMLFVMRIGIKHDPFHDISAIDQSASVTRLRERYGSPKAVQAAVKTLQETGDEAAAKAVGDAVEVKEAEKSAESADAAPTSAG